MIERYEPDLAVVESVFVASSPRAALVLGHARGAALVALGAAGLPIHEFAAREIKQAVTGSGSATKAAVQRAVARTLGLEREPPPDAADALAAALCQGGASPLASLGVRSASRRRAGRRWTQAPPSKAGVRGIPRESRS